MNAVAIIAAAIGLVTLAPVVAEYGMVIFVPVVWVYRRVAVRLVED